MRFAILLSLPAVTNPLRQQRSKTKDGGLAPPKAVYRAPKRKGRMGEKTGVTVTGGYGDGVDGAPNGISVPRWSLSSTHLKGSSPWASLSLICRLSRASGSIWRSERNTVIGAKISSGRIIRASGILSFPPQQAVDMIAPETFATKAPLSAWARGAWGGPGTTAIREDTRAQ